MSILTQAQKRAAILAGVEARELERKQTYARWAAEEAEARKPSESAVNVRTKDGFPIRGGSEMRSRKR